MKLDVIGDVHGQFEKLVSLLSHLGYGQADGAWRHRRRTAVFVGDLIDRGPKQVDTVDLVRRMVAAGTAHCIMGNHEFNAIAWATEYPPHSGTYLRDREKPRNLLQHQRFLEEYADLPRHADAVDWFRTLPLWLDFGGLRVVHACWDQRSMDVLRPLLGPNQTLTGQLIVSGNTRGHAACKAIETVCKGPEIELPGDLGIPDKEGIRRRDLRVGWWHADLSTYRAAAHVTAQDLKLVPELPTPEPWHSFSYVGPPVIFGHYWFTPPPRVISGRFACVDFSAAHGGPLVAYRWDGEKQLSSKKLAWA